MIRNIPSNKSVLLLWLTVITAYRLGVIWFNQLPLYFDEAYYLSWAQTPAFGYFSKPPMVAWLISLSTTVFGLSELAVKLPAALLYAATALIVAQLGERLFSAKIGFWCGIAFSTVPIVGFNSLFITTDAPLLFFWALTLLGFLKALQDDSWGWWLAAGVAGGLGLLSKYTMGVLAVSLLVYLLGSRQYRTQLLNIKLWMAALLALLVFLPNIIWNMQHDFISVQHTADISQMDRIRYTWDELAEFIGAQFLTFGFILMGWLVYLLLQRVWSYNEAAWFCVAVLAPVLLIMCLQAFFIPCPCQLGGAYDYRCHRAGSSRINKTATLALVYSRIIV